MSRLAEWNAQSEAEALLPMLACCGSARFAQCMVRARPFADPSTLQDTADEVWWSLTEADWMEAFLCHPRIGESAAGASAQFSKWSAEEQRGARAGSSMVLRSLADKNREYEQRHGFLYIVCANGRTADELLSLLAQRITNSREVEVREAADQQRQITQLRLRKWLDA